MDTADFELYKGKNFADLCKDIVKNSEEKRNQLDILVTDLRDQIKTVNDAQMVIPLLKEYFDVGVRNDEQLIKLAAIVQRLMAGKSGGDENINMVLTEEEKKQLLSTVAETAKAVDKKEAVVK
jgi:S-adenosylmethionine:tRNA-ribosyltransferase-isomerase (queuine synthetase)